MPLSCYELLVPQQAPNQNFPSSWPQKGKKIVTEEVAKVGASLVAQLVKKNPPAVQETQDRFLGQEDNLEKG